MMLQDDARMRLDGPVVLVGLMGAGKSSIGRRAAEALGAPFYDSDKEIEAAAGRSISEIFETYGEDHFREGERRVIARLMEKGPMVLATGGGAFMDAKTRALIKDNAISVWLKADLDTLVRRTSRRNTRPLLRQGDPRKILARLMSERHRTYAEADITVRSVEGPHERTVGALLAALKGHLRRRARAERRRQKASPPPQSRDDASPEEGA